MDKPKSDWALRTHEFKKRNKEPPTEESAADITKLYATLCSVRQTLSNRPNWTVTQLRKVSWNRLRELLLTPVENSSQQDPYGYASIRQLIQSGLWHYFIWVLSAFGTKQYNIFLCLPHSKVRELLTWISNTLPVSLVSRQSGSFGL